MRTHIDWLTFTLTMRYSSDGGDAEAYATAIENAIDDMFPTDLRTQIFGYQWEVQERSRAPYTDAWTMNSGLIRLFASPNLSHCCIEISGQGCEVLIHDNLMNELLTIVHERVTRIDIACDIETETKPTEFVACVKHERMRASGYQKSETGETCYVGSQKSDRYSRVYRYLFPHPRHNLLRVEHVFRRDYAKAFSKACVGGGADLVARACGEAFGWSHVDWKPDMDQSLDISYVKAERKMGKTVFWLIKSCAPAFQRLCAEGTITDPQRFLNDYFLPQGEP